MMVRAISSAGKLGLSPSVTCIHTAALVYSSSTFLAAGSSINVGCAKKRFTGFRLGIRDDARGGFAC